MATLTEQLAEAQAAFHDLMIGKAVAEFRDQSGEVVRYTQADKQQLKWYISDLQRQIDALNGSCHSSAPLRVVF